MQGHDRLPEWPEVTLGGPNEPYVEREAEEERSLPWPKKVVAFGTVAGIPWTLTAFVTTPVGEWWENEGPVGPEMQFFLGPEGEYGGGDSQARIPEGTHLTMTGHFFGRFPELMAWIGFVSEQIDHVEVRLSDGRVRRVDPSPGPEGFFPQYFLLFRPAGPKRRSWHWIGVEPFSSVSGCLRSTSPRTPMPGPR